MCTIGNGGPSTFINTKTDDAEAGALVIDSRPRSTLSPPPPRTQTGAYDVNTCDSSLMFWPGRDGGVHQHAQTMLLFEAICTGPSATYCNSPFGYYPQHAEMPRNVQTSAVQLHVVKQPTCLAVLIFYSSPSGAADIIKSAPPSDGWRAAVMTDDDAVVRIGSLGNPYPAVPHGHPRVYMTAALLPALRAKVKTAPKLWKAVADLAGADPVVQAFTSLIERNASLCVRAVKAQATVLAKTLNFTGAPSSQELTKAGRTFLSAQHTTAVVLDYCEGATGSFCLLLCAKL
jgi:hypothetical protein